MQRRRRSPTPSLFANEIAQVGGMLERILARPLTMQELDGVACILCGCPECRAACSVLKVDGIELTGPLKMPPPDATN